MKNYQQIDNRWACEICDRSFTSRQGVTSHIHRAHTKPGIAYGGHATGTPAWNKGLSASSDERVKRGCETFNARIASGEIVIKGKPHSEESKRKISERMSGNNRGGKCKWFNVAGQKVQGTWERNVALKFEELKIVWRKLKTHKDVLNYVMDGQVKSYTPDFYLEEFDVFLEIKGYWWGRDREKMDIVLIEHKDKKIIIAEKVEYEKILKGELIWLLP